MPSKKREFNRSNSVRNMKNINGINDQNNISIRHQRHRRTLALKNRATEEISLEVVLDGDETMREVSFTLIAARKKTTKRHVSA